MLSSRNFVLSALITVSPFAFATSGQGSFTATKICPMYQSEVHKTNPDNAQTAINQKYQVVEFLGTKDNPQWIRVNTNQKHSPLRWVNAQCGNADLHPSGGGSSDDSCHTPKTFTSHVLALSWVPGFCNTRGSDTPECIAIKNGHGGIETTQLSLHGLWPNKTGCGIDYNFCAGHGKISVPPLNESVTNQLHEYMPNTRYGDDLETHEWDKHGTCEGLAADDYFGLATSLVAKVDQSALVTNFIQSNIGKTVTKSEFEQAIDSAFGADSHQFVGLQCSSNQLIGLEMTLPEQLDKSQSISELLSLSHIKAPSNCSDSFVIK